MSRAARPGPQLPYRLLAGVVPCAGGWLVASGKLVGVTLFADSLDVAASFREVLDHVPSYTAVAVGAPIGLYDEGAPGGRRCDVEARRLLGWPRLGAIASPPGRGDLTPAAIAAASRMRRRWLQRVAELDAEMEPYRQRSVFAAHPELSLWSLNGEVALKHGKHTELGLDERDALVRNRVQGAPRLMDRCAELGLDRAAALDAIGVLWTARKLDGHAARRLPEDPEWDTSGLRIEWAV